MADSIADLMNSLSVCGRAGGRMSAMSQPEGTTRMELLQLRRAMVDDKLALLRWRQVGETRRETLLEPPSFPPESQEVFDAEMSWHLQRGLSIEQALAYAGLRQEANGALSRWDAPPGAGGQARLRKKPKLGWGDSVKAAATTVVSAIHPITAIVTFAGGIFRIRMLERCVHCNCPAFCFICGSLAHCLPSHPPNHFDPVLASVLISILILPYSVATLPSN